MLLVIDVGNTNTVFALYEGESLKQSWRCETNPLRTGDEYAAWLFQAFQIEGFNFKNVNDVIVSSVVPDTNFNLKNLGQRYFNVDVIFVGVENVKTLIDISIDHPHQAGADLLVNAIGCSKHHSTDAIIVDFGTATTLSVITKSGGYGGGIIAPGINLSLGALTQAAAKLPKIDIQKPPQVRGTNTVHAMQSGIFWGYVSMVEGLISRLQLENGDHLKVVVTGGLGKILGTQINNIDVIDDDLTLKGLLEIYNKQKKV